MLRAIGIEHPSNGQCKECGSILRELLGGTKRINGRDKWRVPFVALTFNESLDQIDELY